jgi:hypothetical protein
MVAVIMVAEEFGTGRGTLFDILELLFGEDYVVPCEFGELTGTSAGARFNDRLANALIATVNEAADEDGHQQARRRLTYEALKNAIEPSPRARRRFEKKGHDAYAQRSARSTLIATNHRDVVKLPRDDRRICILTCGTEMTAAETMDIRAWMAVTENIGALHIRGWFLSGRSPIASLTLVQLVSSAIPTSSCTIARPRAGGNSSPAKPSLGP